MEKQKTVEETAPIVAEDTRSLRQQIRATPEDLSDIVTRIKDLRRKGWTLTECCRAVADETGKTEGAIYKIWRAFTPTTDLSTMYLQAKALKLAAKIVRDANVDQAIDVLSRKNIGVLAPKTEQGAGQGGFFLSVQAENCGVVKIGEGPGPQALPPAPQTAFELYSNKGPEPEEVVECNDYSVEAKLEAKVDVFTEEKSLTEEKSEGLQRITGTLLKPVTKKQQAALDAHRRKLKEAQREGRRLKKAWIGLGGEV